MSLFTSLSFERFLVASEKIFLVLPSRTNPRPSRVVTNGSHAYASVDWKENDPIDHMFGTDFPA